MSKLKPYFVSPPGDTILDILAERFAEAIQLSDDDGANLIKGDLPIDEDLAEKLANHLGGDSKFWLTREKNYRNWLENKGFKCDEEALKAFEETYSQFSNAFETLS